MKFARYLQDTQTPEWKTAYIDYRGLKKQINAIKLVQEGITSLPGSHSGSQVALPSNAEASTSSNIPHLDLSASPLSAALQRHSHTKDTLDHFQRGSNVARVTTHDRELSLAKPPVTRMRSATSNKQGKLVRAKNRSVTSRRSSRVGSNTPNFGETIYLHDLLPLLSPEEKSFFSALDMQLEKIECFYLDREKEMQLRNAMLKQQLDELSDHRKLYYAAHPSDSRPWSSALKQTIKFSVRSRFFKHQSMVNATHVHPNEDTQGGSAEFQSTDKADENHENDADRGSHITGHHINHGAEQHLDPDDYLHAKKKLKKAVLEHYRGLEVLHNYQILNITGFRKALKKFEKTTKIPAQDAYMTEKIKTSAMSSDTSVNAMIKETEILFAARFERGDKKRAVDRLRAGSKHKGHHHSTFRTGVLVGLAVPSLVSGIYQSFQKSTREAIPAWGALLNVYGVMLIPVLFSLLVGVNLLVFSRSRINYVFIFELDTRTRLDHREYFELPSLLLTTLSYAFWLSFSRVGAPSVSPTLWPLVWLGFAALVVFDPLPVQFKPSRYWLVRNVGKLLISGRRRVEFTDFWMGDQFCSLIYSLSNLYFFACVYTKGFDDKWTQCGSSSSNWGVAFVLASLPLLARLIQSVKRYADSKLITHLINGGKYGSGIVSYLCFFIWRHQGSKKGLSFALWCLFNTVYSLYASSWDLLMDWSLLRPHAKHLLLRPHLIYDAIPLYYLAIVSNIAIRFIWILYIPQQGPNVFLRSFVVGILEMLRRWQWNFYRLENEHLGNMDQYRVTREVPLPYAFDETGYDEDGEDEDG